MFLYLVRLFVCSWKKKKGQLSWLLWKIGQKGFWCAASTSSFLITLPKYAVPLISISELQEFEWDSSNENPLGQLVDGGTFLRRRALTWGQLTSVPGSITYYLWSNVCVFCMHYRVPHKGRIMSLFPYVHIFKCQGLLEWCMWLWLMQRWTEDRVSHPANLTFP